MKFWFITGSQFLYGEETLRQVEADSKEIVAGLQLPFPVEYKLTAKTNEEVSAIVREANYDQECAGIITFCHTFSPSKMWINGFAALQKPWLHFHTQYLSTIPKFAAFQRDHDHILRCHAVIADARGLDDHASAFAVDAADIAPCINDDAAAHKLEVCRADLLFQRFQHCMPS